MMPGQLADATVQLLLLNCGDRLGPTPLGLDRHRRRFDPVEQLFSSSQLADDLFGCVSLALHGASPGQVWPLGKLS